VGEQKGGGRVGGFHWQDSLGEDKNNMDGKDSDDSRPEEDKEDLAVVPFLLRNENTFQIPRFSGNTNFIPRIIKTRFAQILILGFYRNGIILPQNL